MILAGIDEAGLGPALGPLCVACTALHLPDGATPESPWEALASCVARAPQRKDGRLLVTDSKIAFRSRGLEGLERALIPFLALLPSPLPIPCSREDLLTQLASHEALNALPTYPWYRNPGWTFPDTVARHQADNDKASLASALHAAHADITDLRVSILLAGQLNQRFSQEQNKAEVLLDVVGGHIRHLAERYTDEPVLVTVDKLGGRNQYLPFLMSILPGTWIDTESEGAEASVYCVQRRAAELRIAFFPRADQQAFPVALASLLAKYLRERFMGDLNAYFQARLQGLRPTAGYHGDAPRFLRAIESIRHALGIPLEQLRRAR